jgi:hypothetical protein
MNSRSRWVGDGTLGNDCVETCSSGKLVTRPHRVLGLGGAFVQLFGGLMRERFGSTVAWTILIPPSHRFTSFEIYFYALVTATAWSWFLFAVL